MRALALVLLAWLAACPAPGVPDEWAHRSLDPEPNPFGPDDPLWAPQPHRDRPRAIARSADGARLYVALTGADEAHPVLDYDPSCVEGPSGERICPDAGVPDGGP